VPGCTRELRDIALGATVGRRRARQQFQGSLRKSSTTAPHARVRPPGLFCRQSAARFVQPFCQAVGRPEFLEKACDVAAATPAARGLLAEKGVVVKSAELHGRLIGAEKLHRNRRRQRPISVSYSMADDSLRHIGAYHHVAVRKRRVEI
jgi:hypothetical protein